VSRRLKFISAFAVPAALVGVLAVGLADRPERPRADEQSAAPAVRVSGAGDPARILEDIEPDRFPAVLESARPRPVMVDFWASWCEPCRVEMPFITRLRAKYLGRIDFIGVNYQDAREPAEEFIREFNINFPTYRDPDGKIGEGQGGIAGMPTAIFYNGEGREVFRQTGAFPSEARMEEALRRLL
jgi:cytochrome c biogenesis protein CcmG, thiol:disulfide interchange protein DsbE